jgi:hypothetical protein
MAKANLRFLGGSLTGLVLVLAACSSGTMPVGSKYVKTATIGASGGTVTVAASESSAIAGTSITIPPNALKGDVAISIGISTASVTPAHGTSIGPTIDFEPMGTTFAVPVTITVPGSLPNGMSAARVAVAAVDASQNASQLKAVFANGLATLQTTGLEQFAAYVTPADTACSTNADCAPGGVCVAGACQGTRDAGTTDADVPGACSTNADCSTGDVCVSGVCTPPVVQPDSGTDAGDAAPITCSGTQTDCGGVCVDLNANDQNCGACGIVCPSGTHCAAPGPRCY